MKKEILLQQKDKSEKFKNIKKEVEEYYVKHKNIDTTIYEKENEFKTFNIIHNDLIKEIKNIKKWKETHKENPEKLESKLLEKKDILDNLEIKIKEIKKSCQNKLQELDDLLNHFLE